MQKTSAAALVLSIVAIAVAFFAIVSGKAGDSPRQALLATMQAQLAEHEQLVGSKDNLISSYLAATRANGVPAEAAQRQRLAALYRNLVAMRATARAYAPYAEDPAFQSAEALLAEHVAQWSDRWDNVMEIFMAGGNLPAKDPAFPKQWAELVAREAEAAK